MADGNEGHIQADICSKSSNSGDVEYGACEESPLADKTTDVLQTVPHADLQLRPCLSRDALRTRRNRVEGVDGSENRKKTSRVCIGPLKEWEELLQKVKDMSVSYVTECENIDKQLTTQAEETHRAVDEIILQKKTQLMDGRKAHLIKLKAKEMSIKKRIYELKRTMTTMDSGENDHGVMRFEADEVNSKNLIAPKSFHFGSLPVFVPGRVRKRILSEMIGELSLELPYSNDAHSLENKLTLMKTPTVVSSFDSGYNVPFVACAGGRLTWVGTGSKTLSLVDKEGTLNDIITTDFDFKCVRLNQDGGILLADSYNRIKLVSRDGVVRLFKTRHVPWGICCLQSGYIVVTFSDDNRVTQFSRNGGEIYEFNRKLFKRPRSVAENKVNNDLYICNETNSTFQYVGKLLAFDRHHTLLYEYTGPGTGQFDPWEVCTDYLGHVLIIDADNNLVHILDQYGVFLQYLLTSGQGLEKPRFIDVDNEGHAWIGQYKGQVKIVKYLN